jgi:hypothetical protein
MVTVAGAGGGPARPASHRGKTGRSSGRFALKKKIFNGGVTDLVTGWPVLRYARLMRYPDGGGLDAAERARRKQVRLAAGVAVMVAAAAERADFCCDEADGPAGRALLRAVLRWSIRRWHGTWPGIVVLAIAAVSAGRWRWPCSPSIGQMARLEPRGVHHLDGDTAL